jgi:voltage-gated potassium channel
MGQGSYFAVRRRVRQILSAQDGDRAGHAFSVFIVTLILLNVTAMILQSVKSIEAVLSQFFTDFEYFSVIAFSIEYVLRVWSCVEEPKYRRPILGRVRFAFTPLAIIDLLAVLPFYLPFLHVDLRMLRMLRILRIMRLAKLGRYSESLQILGRVFAAKKEQLASTVAILLMLLIFSSCLMYFIEGDQQPDKFSSIPATMWWAVTTLTTVGYGDVSPITDAGKFVGSILAILGIGMFALPTGILGAGFMEEMTASKKPPVCPHCGKAL